MYESPITMIQETISQQMKQEEDKYVMEIERAVGFHIDKQELIRALNYDRDQYNKGFNDAKRQFDRLIGIGHWVNKPNIYGVVYCSECDYELHINNTNYCPNCGAKMIEETEEEEE